MPLFFLSAQVAYIMVSDVSNNSKNTKNLHTLKKIYAHSHWLIDFNSQRYTDRKLKAKKARMMVWFHLNYVFRFDSSHTHTQFQWLIWILTAHLLIPNIYKRKWYIIMLFRSNRLKKKVNKKSDGIFGWNFRCCLCASHWVYHNQSGLGTAFCTHFWCMWEKNQQFIRFWSLLKQSVKVHICTAPHAFGPFGHDPK